METIRLTRCPECAPAKLIKVKDKIYGARFFHDDIIINTDPLESKPAVCLVCNATHDIATVVNVHCKKNASNNVYLVELDVRLKEERSIVFAEELEDIVI